MAGARFDYASERLRHQRFGGRAALLARLDAWLDDGSVVITGGPGMGKTALVAAWVWRREAAGAVVPHHFIRRGMYEWDDPAKLVGSLVAQLADGFPNFEERWGDDRAHPALRLGRALAWVSAHELVPRGARLVVVIDGLDEYAPPAGDPLAAFLPEALPAGVRLLCSSRPGHPPLASLAARAGALVALDLDDPDQAADNDATVRALWARLDEPLGIDARFIDTVVERAGGNLQHAVQLQKRLMFVPLGQREHEVVPRGLAALIEAAWARVAAVPVAVDGLGILCAAREALTVDEIAAVAGWDAASRATFQRVAKELLVGTAREGGLEYRLSHDAIRAYVVDQIGDAALRAHHGALARRFATWPTSSEGAARRYALRHALFHRAEIGAWSEVWRLAIDPSFLEAKARALGAQAPEADLRRIAERCRSSGDPALAARLDVLAEAVWFASQWFDSAPEAMAVLLWNQLRRRGWRTDELDAQLGISPDTPFPRVGRVMKRVNPTPMPEGHAEWVKVCVVTPDGRRAIWAGEDLAVEIRDLETGGVVALLAGHTHRLNACALTPDGRRLVSAAWDATLRVWDLEAQRCLRTLQGHTSGVTACAVTPDGRWVLSGSADHTLRVWELETGRALATLAGHAEAVTACVVTPDGRRVVSASNDHALKIWDLETGHLHRTLIGHDAPVVACAVTPDGRRVISASWDRTLKLWDAETGDLAATWTGHEGTVEACAVTPDGRRVVSASSDCTLKLWDLETGACLLTHYNDGSYSAVVVTERAVVTTDAAGDLCVLDWPAAAK